MHSKMISILEDLERYTSFWLLLGRYRLIVLVKGKTCSQDKTKTEIDKQNKLICYKSLPLSTKYPIQIHHL